MINPKYASQIQRNYESYKQAISRFCRNQNMTDSEERNLFVKADLYNIDPTDFVDDFIGLEQAIDAVEISERKIKSSDREDYYSTRGC
jgi:hypothetical protein